MEKKIKTLRICGYLVVAVGILILIFFQFVDTYVEACCFGGSPYSETIGTIIALMIIIIGGIPLYIAYNISRKQIQTSPTELSDGWQCRKCGANNPNTRKNCVYCGQQKD